MARTKFCTLCGKEKLLSDFYKKGDAKDGLDWGCKPCKRDYFRDRYAAKFRKRPILPDGQKFCPVCKRVLPVEAFGINPGRRDGRQVYCGKCWPQYMRKYRQRPVPKETELAKTKRLHRDPAWLPKNRQKIYARSYAQLAIAFGDLV